MDHMRPDHLVDRAVGEVEDPAVGLEQQARSRRQALGHGEGDHGGGFIFDGFPRTLAQADALGALLTKHGAKLDAVVEMRVDDNALVQRITARSTCGDCGEVYNDITKPIPADGKCTNCGGTEFKRRADDNEESLKTRLMEYYKKTSPLLGYYYALGLLKRVDGLADMKVVQASIGAILDN